MEPGQAKNTYGTGCFLLMHTGDKAVKSTHGLLTTIACGPRGEVGYALEGAVFNGGSTVQWLRDELKVINDSFDSGYFATKVKDTQRRLPGAGLHRTRRTIGTPMRAARCSSLTRGVKANHLIRATLESIAYQTRDVLDAMQRDAGERLRALRVDGGAVANNFLMQFQADILGTRVERPVMRETTAPRRRLPGRPGLRLLEQPRRAEEQGGDRAGVRAGVRRAPARKALCRLEESGGAHSRLGRRRTVTSWRHSSAAMRRDGVFPGAALACPG
ncbi:FGGY-family carbohydrate kinase [Pseudomonas aeruginosa]